jgi:hypothetical protein
VIGVFTIYEYMKIGYENRAERLGHSPRAVLDPAPDGADRREEARSDEDIYCDCL